jgi:hypothetical protein
MPGYVAKASTTQNQLNLNARPMLGPNQITANQLN